MHSAKAILAALALAALGGCATTQQKAAWLRLNSARLRASQLPVRVSGRNREIRVEHVTIVAGSGGSAVVVRLRNLTGRPVSDLPISLGLIESRGHRRYLNGSANLSYFDTHVPAIAAGRAFTWVFRTPRRLPAAAPAFAEIGSPAPVPLPRVLTLPSIRVSSAGARSGAELRLLVRNASSVPQYQLPVYAFAVRRGRVVAAAVQTIGDLGAGSAANVKLKLFGDPAHATLSLESAPTIFN